MQTVSWTKTLCLLLALLAAGGPARAFDEDHLETLNGTRLHFRVRGTNRTHPYLLILHGGPGFSAHMFYDWGTSLEPALNLVYLDQRGCGQSARLHFAKPNRPKPAEIKGYTIATLIEDIEAVRRSLGVDRWFVLGHSWGGMLGLEYVRAHPDQVRGYIHMDGLVSVPLTESAMLDNERAWFTRQAADPAHKAHAQAELAHVRRVRALPPGPDRLGKAFEMALNEAPLYFAHNQQASFLACNFKVMLATQPYGVPTADLQPAEEPGMALSANDGYITRDDRPLLPQITVPTLIINGRQDGVITPGIAGLVHAGIKGSELVVLDRCGHFPFFEQPRLTTQTILHWTSRQK